MRTHVPKRIANETESKNIKMHRINYLNAKLLPLLHMLIEDLT